MKTQATTIDYGILMNYHTGAEISPATRAGHLEGRTMIITITNTHATEIPNGVYRVLRDCLLTHFRGKGDGRVRVETMPIAAGQTLAYASTPANGYWWGIELGTVEQIHGEQRAEAIEQVADPGEVMAAFGPPADNYNSRINDVAKMIRESEVRV